MISKKIAAAIVLPFLLIKLAYAVDLYADAPTKEASELTKQYVIADDNSEKKAILEKLHSLAKNNTDNRNVIRMYSGMLASIGEYKQAISVLNAFNKEHTSATLMLHECMLKDRMGDYDSSCYENVITLKKSKGVNDIDYLMALFMTNNKDFNKEKDAYIKRTDNKQDLDAFNNEKKMLLKKLYPN
ncbi:hypothetical protein ACGVWS_06850 [Enterobacteriaceae bacterium LUAb1]